MATAADGAAQGQADPRLAAISAGLAERLRPICAGWDEARFEALVQQMARVKLRWSTSYETESHLPE